MANKKITELTEETSPQGADLLPLVDDVSGTPTTKKVTVTNLMTLAPQGDLEAANNLSDLNDAATARTNLGLGTAATTASTDYATSSQGALADTAIQPSGITNMVETTDSIDVLADVDTSTVAPTTNDFLKWGGSNWIPAVPTADVDTPLTTALRGTDNPHIGAYPNQPFNALENSAKSVMIITNADGEMDFLIPDGGKLFINSPSGGRVSPSFGFSVSEDANEPDIEVASGGENYSVISGDSDTLTANGLPFRQGFNNPDIGAYAAPILISGGSIA